MDCQVLDAAAVKAANEASLLSAVLDALKKKYAVKSITVRADRELLSAEARAFLRAQGAGCIACHRIARQAPEACTALELDGYRNLGMQGNRVKRLDSRPAAHRWCYKALACSGAGMDDMDGMASMDGSATNALFAPAGGRAPLQDDSGSQRILYVFDSEQAARDLCLSRARRASEAACGDADWAPSEAAEDRDLLPGYRVLAADRPDRAAGSCCRIQSGSHGQGTSGTGLQALPSGKRLPGAAGHPSHPARSCLHDGACPGPLPCLGPLPWSACWRRSWRTGAGPCPCQALPRPCSLRSLFLCPTSRRAFSSGMWAQAIRLTGPAGAQAPAAPALRHRGWTMWTP